MYNLKNRRFYSAYNLSIHSQLFLPELRLLEETSTLEADVIIEFGKVSDEGLVNGQQLGPFLWGNPSSLWLQVPNVAKFLVKNGAEILIDPEPGIDEDSIRVFLLGSVFGALLLQRGHLVLHGNAIRIGDQCMVCVGHSGAGKSTLAAGFVRRGHQILADDVVPLDEELRALPGFPRIKLWRDAADKLEIDTTPLRRIRPDIEKFNFPIDNGEVLKPLPIRWVYVLGSKDIKGIEIDPIYGMQRFLPLRHNTYRVRFLEGMSLKSEHLKLCGQLASSIRLARVTRPNTGFTLDELIDRILIDIEENP